VKTETEGYEFKTFIILFQNEQLFN